MEFSDDPIRSSREEVGDWVKGALEAWLNERDSSVYSPYVEYFRRTDEPHQTIYRIYDSLRHDKSRFPWRSSQSVFRKSLGDILQEPEIFKQNYAVYIELLRLGGLVGSREVLIALAKMIRARALPTDLEVRLNDRFIQINLLSETIDIVLRSGFQDLYKHLVKVLRCCIPQAKLGGLSPLTILSALARHDPNRWPNYATELAMAVRNYFDEEVATGGEVKARHMFRDRLRAILGDDAYFAGLGELAKSEQMVSLLWLMPDDYPGSQIASTANEEVISSERLQNDMRSAGKREWGFGLSDLVRRAA